MDDYRNFEACLLGCGGGISPGCDYFDSDATVADLGDFQISYTGN